MVRILVVSVAIVVLSACVSSERSTMGSPTEAPIPSELSRAALAVALEAGAVSAEVISTDIRR
jgi:hypothetical protein